MARKPELFAADELEAIAKALGHTTEGLTGSEIGHILRLAKLRDVDPAAIKWKRLHNAFVDYQHKKRNRSAVLAFIRKAMKPTRYRGQTRPIRDHAAQREWRAFILWPVSARRRRACPC